MTSSKRQESLITHEPAPGLGKSDPLDARAIAIAAVLLESAQRRFPRLADGARAGLRVLLSAREHMTFERIAKVNALTALLRSVELGVDARSSLLPPQIRSISQWRRRNEELSIAIARTEAKRLAQRIMVLDSELQDNQAHLIDILQAMPAGALLDEIGIGPVNAAIVYTAWSHLASAPKRPSQHWPALIRFQHHQAIPSGTDSTAAATDA